MHKLANPLCTAGLQSKAATINSFAATMRVTCIGTVCGCGAQWETRIKWAGRPPADCSVCLGALCVRRRAADPGADDAAAGNVSWAPAARGSFCAPRTRPPRVDRSLEAERRGDGKTNRNQNRNSKLNKALRQLRTERGWRRIHLRHPWRRRLWLSSGARVTESKRGVARFYSSEPAGSRSPNLWWVV